MLITSQNRGGDATHYVAIGENHIVFRKLRHSDCCWYPSFHFAKEEGNKMSCVLKIKKDTVFNLKFETLPTSLKGEIFWPSDTCYAYGHFLPLAKKIKMLIPDKYGNLFASFEININPSLSCSFMILNIISQVRNSCWDDNAHYLDYARGIILLDY